MSQVSVKDVMLSPWDFWRKSKLFLIWCSDWPTGGLITSYGWNSWSKRHLQFVNLPPKKLEHPWLTDKPFPTVPERWTFFHFFMGAGLAQWWEQSPPTNVARVWSLNSALLIFFSAPRGFFSGSDSGFPFSSKTKIGFHLIWFDLR